MKLASFALNVSDFILGTARMKPEEVGAYIRLLCEQWDKGALPNDPQALQLITGFENTATVMAKFKVGEDGLLRNQRLEQEREKRAPKNKIDASLPVEEREKAFYESLVPHVTEFGAKIVRPFYDYWREKSHSGKKMRFELEKTWELRLRLLKWQGNNDWSANKTPSQPQQINAPDKRLL